MPPAGRFFQREGRFIVTPAGRPVDVILTRAPALASWRAAFQTLTGEGDPCSPTCSPGAVVGERASGPLSPYGTRRCVLANVLTRGCRWRAGPFALTPRCPTPPRSAR